MLPLLLLSLFLVAQPPAIRGQPAEVTVKYALLFFSTWGSWPDTFVIPHHDYYLERLNSGHWNGKRLTAGNTTIRLERDIIRYDPSTGWTAEQMDALTNDTYVALISYGLGGDQLLPLAQHKNLLRAAGWDLDAVPAGTFILDKYPLSPEVGRGILSPFKTRGYTKCAVIRTPSVFYRLPANLIIDAIESQNMTLTRLMDIPYFPGYDIDGDHRGAIAMGYAADEVLRDTYGDNWTFPHEDLLNPGTNKTYGIKSAGHHHLGEDFAEALKETGTEVLFQFVYFDINDLAPDTDTWGQLTQGVYDEFNQILIDRGVDLKVSRSIRK